MFKPSPMQRVELKVLTDDAPKAALILASRGVFNPETTQLHAEELPEFPRERYRELYRTAQSRLDKVMSHCAIDMSVVEGDRVSQVSESELSELNDWLYGVWAKCSECQEGLRRVEEQQKQIDQLITTLDKFSSLDIDLSLLQRDKKFLDIRVGTLPTANVQRLREAVGLADYILTTFLVGDGVSHVIIAGPRGKENDIDIAVQAADWHSIQIPPQFRDHPDKVHEELIRNREQMLEENVAQCQLIENTQKEFKDKLVAAIKTLAMAAPFSELGAALCGRGGLTLIAGWVPSRELPQLQKALYEGLGNRFVLSARAPLPDERLAVPSVMRTHWLFKPFVTLVKTYGVPRYGEIDPTFLFGITFIAMYGMMFGDVGHGGVIAVGAILMRKILKHFTVFVFAIGISSVVFGFLYGSIFGYEEVIHPLWMSPLSDPMLMLTLALYWGIGFIILATLLTIRNRIVDKDYKKAFLDSHGLAGLLFYLGMLYAAVGVASGSGMSLLAIVITISAYAMILGYIWHENKTNIGERILIVLVEGFETIINYISNTLSFLRVAAFSLNHVALAIAVFTLADMLDTTGHWITIVLGNVFIIVFEGAIVAIQVLRLEYYEGFSRFFSGDGREFRPLKLPEWTGAGPHTKAT